MLAVALRYGLAAGIVEILVLLRPDSWAIWLFVPFTLVVIFHYYVDGLIWRFRDYPELRVCYALCTVVATNLASIGIANVAKCNPATVSGSRS